MKRIGKLLWLISLLLILISVLIFPVLIKAQSGKFDLTLQVIPGDYSGKVTPGRDDHLFLEVRNNSNTSVTGLRFSASMPEGWKVAFNPPTLDSLNSGSTYTVDVTVTPPPNADNQNYTITFIATANETRAVTGYFLQVEGGTSNWLWVGAAVVALVIIGFIIIYLRFGRKFI